MSHLRRILRPQVPFDPGRRALYGGEVEVPRDLGPQPLAPSQPGALESERGVPIRLPGANYPPAGAVAFDAIGDANIAPSGTAALVTIAVPNNLRFRMVGIGFGADDEVALQFLTWAILLNGDAVSSGYTNVFAAVGSIRNLTEIFQVVGSSSSIVVQGTMSAISAVTYRVICRVRGWFYLEKEEH